jgi:hypothetical protein
MKFHLHKLPTTHLRRASQLATAHMQPACAQHEHMAGQSVYLQQDPCNISSSLFDVCYRIPATSAAVYLMFHTLRKRSLFDVPHVGAALAFEKGCLTFVRSSYLHACRTHTLWA